MRATAGGFASARSGVGIVFATRARRPAIEGLPAGGTLGRVIVRLMREEGFEGKAGESLLWQSGGRFPAARYLIQGLGKGPVTPDRLREACGSAARRLASAPRPGALKAIALIPPGEAIGDLVTAATEGLRLGAYHMTKYRSNGASGAGLRSVDLVVHREALAASRAAVRKGLARSGATNLTRDIVNEPAIVLTPTRMAEVAREIARREKLEIKVLDRAKLERLGMGALLGVSAGSAQPPCLIHMTYRPRARGGRSGAARPAARIALVGKGITFDSGGLSLKTSAGMETMKLDKAGATAVLGVMSALPSLGPDVEVHGIMAMTENMPSGTAIKPGDVLTTYGGKTIEVLNTDAEGRLILADALGYAQDLKVDRIIDMATLTGACMVALGPVITGVFGNDQEMVDAFLAASRRAGEKMWQLPLEEDYREQIRSDVADIRNTSSTRYGGAITAGLFLKAFVDDAMPWIHLDIAGPAFLESDRGWMRKGATGAAVRSILTYIESLAGR